MKRILLTLLLCALLATPALAGPTFTFTQESQVLGFHKIAAYTNDTNAWFDKTTTNPAVYGLAYPLTLNVGLIAHAVGDTVNDEWIGLGDDGFDLSSGYSTFAMTISNDNDDVWSYRLFATDGANSAVGASWVTIVPVNTATLTLDVSSIDGLNTTLGIQIGKGTDPVYGYKIENSVHTSVLVPAPGAILLGSIGAGLVGWLRRRRMM